MILGPFSINDVESVENLFLARKISFKKDVDKDKIVERTKESMSQGRAFWDGLQAVWYEIADEDFNSVASEMEKYGFVAPSDGSWELSEEDE